MLAIPELAMPRTRKVTTVCNGKREVWSDYEEAKAYAEKLLSIGGEQSSVVYHHCGDIYAKCGNMEQAVNYWIKARAAGEKSKILDKKIKKRKYYAAAKRK